MVFLCFVADNLIISDFRKYNCVTEARKLEVVDRSTFYLHCK